MSLLNRSFPLCLLLAISSIPAFGQGIRVGPFLQDAEPTSIWVVWETTSEGSSEVEYGVSSSLGSIATGESRSSEGSNFIHQTQLTGLQPDTPYYYRVRTGKTASEVYRLRTPATAEQEKPFRFVVYSDTQNGPNRGQFREVINEGVIGFVRSNFERELSDALAFVIEPGDLVSSGNAYEQWKNHYFDEAQALYPYVPLYPVPGNHENDAHWFFDYFHLPDNGTPGFEEHWWYKDHGNVRIIGLDSNSGYRNTDQLRWLDRVLDDAAGNAAIDFVFAQLHHPHLSGIWTPGNTPYTGKVVEKLETFTDETGKPSIHFFGHTHAYERGQSRDHRHLWVNAAAGEGGLDYWGITPPEDYPEFQRVFPNWGFVLVEVEAGEHPKFRLRRVSRGNEVAPKDNEVTDDLTIRYENQAPQQPKPEGPTLDDGPVDPDDLTLQASAFSDPEGDTHLSSHFQLTLVSGDYSNPAREEWIRFENWYAPEGASGKGNGYYSVNTVTNSNITQVRLDLLDPETVYFWRVRYRDDGLVWSPWSEEQAFVTGEAELGACCLMDGTCTEVRESTCESMGGSWQGADTTCDQEPCPKIVTVFREDFDQVKLGRPVDEKLQSANAWSATPPSGWAIDRLGMPEGGVTEWRGWNFANRDWWAKAAENQGRSGFERAKGVIAVADPDEWADAPRSAGTFNSALTSPPIPLAGLQPHSAKLVMDSSWMPEGRQRARIEATYDGRSPQVIAEWASETGAEFKAGAPNETVSIPLG